MITRVFFSLQSKQGHPIYANGLYFQIISPRSLNTEQFIFQTTKIMKANIQGSENPRALTPMAWRPWDSHSQDNKTQASREKEGQCIYSSGSYPGTILSPRDIWQHLETFLFCTMVVGEEQGMPLVNGGCMLGMLLNTPQSTGESLTTKNHPVEYVKVPRLQTSR